MREGLRSQFSTRSQVDSSFHLGLSIDEPGRATPPNFEDRQSHVGALALLLHPLRTPLKPISAVYTPKPCDREGRAWTSRLLGALDEGAKRCLDIVLASCLLVALAPAMLLVALLVAIDGGPVLFSHQRVGVGLRGFGCLKFRTMILGAEPCLEEYLGYHPIAKKEWSANQKLEFDPRITSIGRFLRRTSLDELPQLVNVLVGDMSLVGPRPITAAEAVRYGDDLKLYASVRPGITGLWQVSGRSDVGYDLRVAMDGRYARVRTVVMDVLILAATPRIVLGRRGAK